MPRMLTPPPSFLQAGVMRMTGELADKDAGAASWKRRRAVDESGGEHINEHNRRVALAIEAKLGKYAVDIKQALERGTR
jgi:hypothetical protein